MEGSVAHLRNEYMKKALSKADVAANPIDQFKTWFDEVLKSELDEPNAMSLATVDAKGQPSIRVVLLKDVSSTGFSFFTNYTSKKGHSISQNPKVGLNFFWHELERQIRIEGRAEMIDASQSDSYFQTRPRGSQIGAWASPQSQAISDRGSLEKDNKMMEDRYADQEVPRPEHWGGYLVIPDLVEFWQGRANRLHDRICYMKEGDQWDIKRLAP